MCDSRMQFCPVKYDVLQFCDFYSAILTLWVTAILMSDISHEWRSTLHLGGSLFFAGLLRAKTTGALSFVVPGACAIVLLTMSWVSVGWVVSGDSTGEWWHSHHWVPARDCYINNIWITLVLLMSELSVLPEANGADKSFHWQTDTGSYAKSDWCAPVRLSGDQVWRVLRLHTLWMAHLHVVSHYFPFAQDSAQTIRLRRIFWPNMRSFNT